MFHKFIEFFFAAMRIVQSCQLMGKGAFSSASIVHQSPASSSAFSRAVAHEQNLNDLFNIILGAACQYAYSCNSQSCRAARLARQSCICYTLLKRSI